MSLADEVVKGFPVQVGVLMLWREARGEPYAVKVGVANVLRNRMADPRWPKEMDQVVMQPLQFSSFNTADWNATKFPRRQNKAEWEAFLECARALEESGEKDLVGGANHYHDTSIPTPGWAHTMQETARLGKIVFYKG